MQTGIASVGITSSAQLTDGVVTLAKLAADALLWSMLQEGGK